jgi:phage replication initiation protein
VDTRSSNSSNPASSASGQPPQAAAASSPRLVIRGESPETTPGDGKAVFGAFTDYLNVTFPIPIEWKEPGAAFFWRFSELVGPAFGVMEDLGRGLHGYAHSARFERGQVRFAFGGQAGTALLTIPGEGCALVPQWQRLLGFLRDELKGRITRWDGAVDDFSGVHPVREAVDLYLAGAFNAGGRRPSCSTAGNWITEDEAGRTFYVGKRRNGKLLRVYEKGKQLGLASSPWTRWEVELHNIDRVIPWEVITTPAPYIAGAYPALSWVTAAASRIPTLQRADSISYKKIIFYARVAYGRLVDTMMSREQCDEATVIRLLRRPGVPQRLALTETLGLGTGVGNET